MNWKFPRGPCQSLSKVAGMAHMEILTGWAKVKIWQRPEVKRISLTPFVGLLSHTAIWSGPVSALGGWQGYKRFLQVGMSCECNSRFHFLYSELACQSLFMKCHQSALHSKFNSTLWISQATNYLMWYVATYILHCQPELLLLTPPSSLELEGYHPAK